ncbi:cadherin-like domain-containing protein, partial [Flavobacterium sp. NRK F10]|uniref:Ig-like domain-containing protein n=1 Tax=Flavobacterium sp. NRK F10 TaxID=2954931 RepID=UPI002090C33A
LCDTATVTVVVNPVNDAPVATNDNATTNEDTPVIIDVTANDTDTDGTIDPTTVVVTVNPSNGTVTVDPVTGEVTYTPNPDYFGTDTFEYQVC